MMWRLGVVGSPIEHSLSPQLHDAVSRWRGSKGRRERVELGAKDKTKLNPVMRKEFDALSITMPLKGFGVDSATNSTRWRRAPVRQLAAHAPRRETLGASTDGDGFVNALADSSTRSWGAHVVVLGAGGAASAIVDALVRAASARSPCTDAARPRSTRSSRATTTSTTSRGLPAGRLIVNTTPIEGRVR
jgi:shikimate dehydrogenase